MSPSHATPKIMAALGALVLLAGCNANTAPAPKSEREWRYNMRVEFRIIQVEAESSVFKPL